MATESFHFLFEVIGAARFALDWELVEHAFDDESCPFKEVAEGWLMSCRFWRWWCDVKADLRGLWCWRRTEWVVTSRHGE